MLYMQFQNSWNLICVAPLCTQLLLHYKYIPSKYKYLILTKKKEQTKPILQHNKSQWKPHNTTHAAHQTYTPTKLSDAPQSTPLLLWKTQQWQLGGLFICTANYCLFCVCSEYQTGCNDTTNKQANKLPWTISDTHSLIRKGSCLLSSLI